MGRRKKLSAYNEARRLGLRIVKVAFDSPEKSKHPSERVGLCATGDPSPEEIAEVQRRQAEIRDSWGDAERIKRYWKKPAVVETAEIRFQDMFGGGAVAVGGPANNEYSS